MKKIIFIFSLILSYSLQAKSLKCEDIKDREIQVNPQTSVKVQTINGICSFSVETSKATRKFNYSPKKYTATREWIFQSEGKILVHGSYGSGPTDSSATSYKGYQLFPKSHDLEIHLTQEGSFSITLANGSRIHFKESGEIDSNRTRDLKIKDLPIRIPDIPKEKSELKYEEIDHLSYGDPRKSAIRVYHRQLYSRETSRSIGLEVTKGMYIPLGIEMGKVPGNSTKASYTLFGKDDEKLCNQKMPAHYFFNYLVKCSMRSPNKRCPCKLNEEEASAQFKENDRIEKEIRALKWKLRTAREHEAEQLKSEIEKLEGQYRPKLYSEIYFTCSLDKDNANAFIAGKKISKDNREVEGVSVKESSDILNGLINSNKCNRLKKRYSDCVDCFEKDILNNDQFQKQNDLIEKVIEAL